MELQTLGIELGKTSFHVVGLDLHGCVAVRKKMSHTPTLALHREPACRSDRHGGLRGGAFLGRTLQQEGTPLCGAVRQDEQERLHGCRGDHRSCYARSTMRFVPINTDDQECLNLVVSC